MYLQERYATIEEIARDVFEYVELFYDGKRIYCILGYMSFIKYRLTNYS